ncbi:MAG: Fur family transcriptional regulator [Acidobacteriaceae bacterium]|nr:Fur family transcriptional regulator [Acidobacteriaceae bacterium]
MEMATDIFRDLCQKHGIAMTHQRQVLFETLQSMYGHPSPEDVYVRVKEKVPAISLATVYKNIHLFVDSGLLREVSVHHGTLRVETNQHPHHHLICSECNQITDIDQGELGFTPGRTKLANGFKVERYAVDVIGICPQCQAKQTN